MSRKFTPRETVLLLLLSVLLLLLGYDYLVHRPVSSAMEQADAALQNAAVQIEVETVKARRMAEMQQALEQLSADPGSVPQIADYDNTRNVVWLLNTALAPSEDYNLVFSPVVFEESIARRTIDMTFTCADYDTAKGIIQALSASPYRCEISAVTLTADGTAAQNADLSRDSVAVKLTITFFEYAADAGEAQ